MKELDDLKEALRKRIKEETATLLKGKKVLLNALTDFYNKVDSEIESVIEELRVPKHSILDPDDEWFYKNYYDDNEIRTIKKWTQIAGPYVIIKKENETFSAFHILDTNFLTPIDESDTEEECRLWVKRLGFKVKE